MPYHFNFTTKTDTTYRLEILNREEYQKLDNEEKLEYSSSPVLDDEDETHSLGHQSFIWGIIEANDSGDNGLPEVLDAFMAQYYPGKVQECLANIKQSNGEMSWSDRTDFYWNFIDEEGDEALDASDLFFLDYAYKSDEIYQLIINECISRTKAI